MKYSPQQYASALYEAVKGKTAEKSVTVLNNFSALLKKNRDTALTRKIAEAFERYAHKKERIISGELVSAREMDGRLKSDVVKKMAEKTKADELYLKEKFDDNLIGGFKIKAGEFLLDASLKGTLMKMHRQVRDPASQHPTAPSTG